MLVVMDMSTGKIEKEAVPEFGAFEDEVLNAEWLQPALQLGLQPVVHRDRAPAETEAEAERFLRLMSGRRHRVITAVAVRRGERLWQKAVETAVAMKRLSEPEIAAYVASGDWQGKAGGYGIQGPAGALIPWIGGSFTAVVGLPLAETAGLLTAAGFPVWRTA